MKLQDTFLFCQGTMPASGTVLSADCSGVWQGGLSPLEQIEGTGLFSAIKWCLLELCCHVVLNYCAMPESLTVQVITFLADQIPEN